VATALMRLLNTLTHSLTHSSERDRFWTASAGYRITSVCRRDRAGYYRTTVLLPWLLLNYTGLAAYWAYEVGRGSRSITDD